MDPELTALASMAAATVVKLLASAAWEKARAAIGGLWRKAHPERVDTVRAELAETRDEVLAAREAGDEAVERELVVEWQGRLRRLLATHPEVAAELRRLLAEDLALEPAEVSGTVVTMTATASGHSRVYQAGRDQQIARGDH